MKYRLKTPFFIYFLVANLSVFASPIIILQDENQLQNIGFQTLYLEDPSAVLTLDSILTPKMQERFALSNQNVLNFGITASAIWCKFEIKRNTSEPIYLEIANPLLNRLTLFEKQSDHTYKETPLGSYLPYFQREIKVNNYIIPLNLKPNEQAIFYLRVHSIEPVLIPLKAGTMQALFEKYHQIDWFQGMYFGFMILMALYNLFIFFTVKDSVYLIYVAYIISVGIMIAFLKGYTFVYLWPGLPQINLHGPTIVAISSIFAILFTINFLKTYKYVPKMHKGLVGFLLVYVLVIALNFSFTQEIFPLILLQSSTFLAIILFFIISITMYLGGIKRSKYFLLAWSIFLVCIVIFILKDNQILPQNAFTTNSMQIGSSLEVLLLSFALADRINLYKKKKEQAQKQALASLKEKERYISEQNRILEQKVKERTLELEHINEELNTSLELIEKEKNKSEKLLLNILPKETALELKETGFATPKHYNMVSVLFTDFKNFSHFAQALSPEKLLYELNSCFVAFDEVIARHQLEKIKTIGDSYMCAGGIPVPDQTNPYRAVAAALEIQEFMTKLKKEKELKGEQCWELRIGIHTGPAVAGVVGKNKFAYDIWGDTVNMASRMESGGEPGKVNISGHTYQFVKDKYQCNYRGKVDVKNQGEVDMYFVTGHIAPQEKGGAPILKTYA
jgi:class 3 adenylate cyclase